MKNVALSTLLKTRRAKLFREEMDVVCFLLKVIQKSSTLKVKEIEDNLIFFAYIFLFIDA